MSRNRKIEFWPDGAASPSQRLCWTYDVRSHFDEAATAIAAAFPPAAADLWEIAAACYAVDRRVKRPPSGSWAPDAWRRDIRLLVPVRRRPLWERHRHKLQRLLAWLTCDNWTVLFRDPRPGEIPGQAVQPRIPGTDDWPEDRSAALFSGGLDSTAGILRELTGDQARKFLLTVSVATNAPMRGAQEDLLDRIRGRLGVRLVSTPFRLNLSTKHSTECQDKENTQRTRGFVFLAAGVAAALTAGCRRLSVYENGIGAINLPCTWGQVGAQAARPVHPRTIALMQAITDVVAEDSEDDEVGEQRSLPIETPYLWWTKAQLIGDLPRGLDAVLRAAVSCDTGFSARGGGGLDRHCGGCSSCVLRRVALIAAGRLDLEVTAYRGTPDTKTPHLRAMLWQVARIAEAVSSDDPWRAMVWEFPDLLCLPSALDDRLKENLTDLYRRYCRDWSAPGVAEALGFRPADWGLPISA